MDRLERFEKAFTIFSIMKIKKYSHNKILPNCKHSLIVYYIHNVD